MLFKEIIAVYCENHTKPTNTKCGVTGLESGWYIQLPFGFKGLNSFPVRNYKYSKQDIMTLMSIRSFQR